jgi:hypothetical protein
MQCICQVCGEWEAQQPILGTQSSPRTDDHTRPSVKTFAPKPTKAMSSAEQAIVKQRFQAPQAFSDTTED